MRRDNKTAKVETTDNKVIMVCNDDKSCNNSEKYDDNNILNNTNEMSIAVVVSALSEIATKPSCDSY